jgi:predicted O-linked N-acetylglucosamine transferase (SPINDLY family)
MEEGQDFYQAICAKGFDFPLEWEFHVLRATLAELPERQDLLERLAVVDVALTHKMPAIESLTERLEWERAWVRFSNASLIGLSSPEAVVTAHARAFSDACVMLSNPRFEKLPVAKRATSIVALHDTLMSAPSHELVLIADLGIRQFCRMLEDPELTLVQALKTYDALHSLYFAGVTDVLELQRFDAVVPLFEKWLTQRSDVNSCSAGSLKSDGDLNIAYLLHTAHYDRGNAVSPLIVSLADAHATVSGRRVFLYLVQYSNPEFIDEISGRTFKVRSFPQGSNYDRIDKIAENLLKDRIDVVLTEQNRAIATALFVRRVAPLQIWIDTGFPFWSLHALDWTLSPTTHQEENALGRKSHLTWRQPESTLRRPVNQVEVTRLRSSFPEDAFILGVFARLVKLSTPFLQVLSDLLMAEPKFRLIIAGTGNPEAVLRFMEQPRHAGRIQFLNENVDLNVYAQVVDVMCDTFPFIGGNACREVASHGTPVVSMLGTRWDALLREDRSSDLLAIDALGYIDLVRRLYRDRDFRIQQRQIMMDMLEQQTNPRKMIDDVETAIAVASTLHREKARHPSAT